MSWEVPIFATTSLDYYAKDMASPRAKQTHRREIRRLLNLPEPMRHSLGRRGMFSVDFLPFFFAWMARLRWRETDSVEVLCHHIRDQGFPDLVRGDAYVQAEQRVVSAVRAQAPQMPEGMNTARLVNTVVHRLLKEDDDLLYLARRSSDALRRLARERPELERVNGRVVRIEGPSTLLTLENPERHELRLIDSQFLKRFDIVNEGDPFVLYRQRWTPDTTVEHFLPAIDDTAQDDGARNALEDRMKAAEVPLQSLQLPQ